MLARRDDALRSGANFRVRACFRISGGNIRNVVAAAAYRAAAESRAVSMADLIHTGCEYRKLGHLNTEAEFGPNFDLVAS